MDKNIQNCIVASWNSCSINKKLEELSYFLIKHEISILCVSETLLKEKHKLSAKGFSVYRSDNGRGVALLIKNNISHYPVVLPSLKSLVAVGAIVNLNKKQVLIISAYLSPSRPNKVHRSDFLKIFNLHNNTMIFGDLNSKHVSWNCPTNNRNGIDLLDLSLSLDFRIVAPDEPTYFPDRQPSRRTGVRPRPSVLDIALIKGLPLNVTVQSVCELSSDHNPVTFQFGGDLDLKDNNVIFDFKNADWKKYRAYIDANISINPSIPNIDELNNLVSEFQTHIIVAAETSIPKINVYFKNNDIPPLIKLIIKIKNAVKRTYQKNNLYWVKSLLNKLVKLVSALLAMHRNKNWNATLSQVRPGDGSLYKIMRRIKTKSKRLPPLLKNEKLNLQSAPFNAFAYTDRDKASLLADTFGEIFKLHSDIGIPSFTRKVIHQNKSYLQPIAKHENVSLTSPKEISIIISKLKNNKSPGDDGINNLFVKNLSKKSIIHLTKIVNHILIYGYFPDLWKKAKIIVLLKPGKNPALPSSYRPISLLNSLAKVTERIIKTRLTKFIECNHILSNYQHGFRTQHSTVSQLARVIDTISHNYNLRKHTGMALVDVEKAFDTVWHQGLIYKLIAYNFPKYLIYLINSYLTNRYFYIFIENVKSLFRKILAGVPQGSVLGPILFILYIDAITSIKMNCNITLFADDTAFFISSFRIDSIAKQLSIAIDKCFKYFHRWKLKPNKNKTEVILFTKRRPNILRNVEINGFPIPWSTSVKYLGVQLDSKLTFTKHINTQCDKAIGLMQRFFPVFNNKSHLSISNKKLLYYLYIRPVLLYACPVWINACKTNFRKLQITQNKSLRFIGSLPRWTPILHMHEVLDIPPIYDYVLNLAKNFFLGCELSNYDHIKSIGDFDPNIPVYKKYKHKRLKHLFV